MYIFKKNKVLFPVTALMLASFQSNININSFATSNVLATSNLGVWEELSDSMPSPRGNLASQIYKGKIYMIGGINGNNVATNRVDIYDIKTDSWETGASMPTSRFAMTSEIYKNKIYVIGGATDYNTETPKVEIYDIDKDTWTTGSDMLPGYDYDYVSSVMYNGKIYCISTDVIQAYDIQSDSWEVVAVVPTPRSTMEAELYNGKIYTIGGYAQGNRVDTVEVYDIKNDTWETKTPMPTAKNIFASELYNGKIYTIGGFNGSSLDKVEVYDIKSDTWSERTIMLEGRAEIETVRLGNKIYVIGGIDTLWKRSGKVEVLTLEELSLEEQAIEAVEKAEATLLYEDINSAKEAVDILTDRELQILLYERLNELYLNETLEPKVITGNIDIYVKSDNMLSMSLDTNHIDFSDFNGVEDMEKNNAVNISINSSLPYQLNAYLVTEIQNADKTKTMDKEILQLREKSEPDYQYFQNVNEKMVLKDNCPWGNDLSHNIDMRLKGGLTYEKDIYKATIKFEVEQK